jgi:hypothetical protein
MTCRYVRMQDGVLEDPGCVPGAAESQVSSRGMGRVEKERGTRHGSSRRSVQRMRMIGPTASKSGCAGCDVLTQSLQYLASGVPEFYYPFRTMPLVPPPCLRVLQHGSDSQAGDPHQPRLRRLSVWARWHAKPDASDFFRALVSTRNVRAPSVVASVGNTRLYAHKR